MAVPSHTGLVPQLLWLVGMPVRFWELKHGHSRLGFFPSFSLFLFLFGCRLFYATPPTSYSRLIARAQAMLQRPHILMLDEPTNHLDAATVAV